MIDADPKLAGLFFKQSARSTANTTKNITTGQTLGSGVDPKKLGLTLANVKLHEKNASQSNDRFLPKINKLINLVQNPSARTADHKS